MKRYCCLASSAAIRFFSASVCSKINGMLNKRVPVRVSAFETADSSANSTKAIPLWHRVTLSMTRRTELTRPAPSSHTRFRSSSRALWATCLMKTVLLSASDVWLFCEGCIVVVVVLPGRLTTPAGGGDLDLARRYSSLPWWSLLS